MENEFDRVRDRRFQTLSFLVLGDPLLYNGGFWDFIDILIDT